MRLLKKVSFIVLLMAICFAFTPAIKAANKLGVIITPKESTTFYRGETINYKAQITNNTTGPAHPYVLITKENSGAEAYKEFIGLVPGETQILSGSFTTKNIKKGTYYIVAYVNNFGASNTVRGDYISSKIYIMNLKAPKKVKAVGKKKKVKVSYKKVGAATSYCIYRSKKNSSGFKYIGSTTSTKYVDKKVKRHKTYYYKVKSVRSINGVAKSSYSKVDSARTK